MSPFATWSLIVVAGGALVALVVALDWWIDTRPGGRKHDTALRHLHAQERARAAMRRQHEQHIRYGHGRNEQ